MELSLDTFEEIDESYTSDNASLLLKAAHTGDMDDVVRLVEEKKHNPYQKGKFGNCSLHYAAAGGRVNVLHYLVDSKGCSHYSPEGHCVIINAR